MAKRLDVSWMVGNEIVKYYPGEHVYVEHQASVEMTLIVLDVSVVDFLTAISTWSGSEREKVIPTHLDPSSQVECERVIYRGVHLSFSAESSIWNH